MYFERDGLRTVFVPFQNLQQCDYEFGKKVLEQMKNKEAFELVKFGKIEEGYIDEIVSIFKEAEFVYGMRLHSLILGVILGKKVYGISYSKKVGDFLKGQSGCVI